MKTPQQLILDEIEQVSQDPALRGSWVARNRAFIKRIVDLAGASDYAHTRHKPLPSSFVALQITLYDNMPEQTVKGKNRYGFQFKVWTGDPEMINLAVTPETHLSYGDLLTPAQIREQAFMLNNDRPHFNPKRKKKKTEIRANPITEEYSLFLETLAATYPDSMFALVYNKSPGTTYHHGQILRVRMSDDRKTIYEAELYLTDKRIDLPPFVGYLASKTPDGKPKPFSHPAGKRTLLQCRVAIQNRHSGWATK